MSRSFDVRSTGTGRDVVFIPGAACDGSVWDGIVERLGDEYRCHCLSPAGFAGKAPVEGSLLDALLDDLVEWIPQLECPAFVGHSLGAFVALRLAIGAPAQVGPLALVDGVPAFGELIAPGAHGAELRRAARARSDMFVIGTPEEIRRRHEESFATMFVDTEHARQVTKRTVLTDPEVLATTMYELWTADLRAGVQAIETPVLLLAPGWPGFAEAQIERRHALYRKQLVNFRRARMVVVEEARHFMMYDTPDRIAELLRAHLCSDTRYL